MDDNLTEEKPTEQPAEPEPQFENLETPKPFGMDPDPEPEVEPQSYAPLPSRKRNPKKLLFLAVAAVVILLVLFKGISFISSKFNKPSPTPTPVVVETPTPTPTEQASATPIPTSTPTATPASSSNPIDSATRLDRSKLSVAVQNGSGESGVGAKAASFLKNLGYNVVSTGNADNFNFTNVTIQVKASQKAYLPLLNKDLSTSYSVGTTSSDLSATSSADALVIIGK